MQGKEIWKDVVGFEEYFQVSNFGNVFSKRTNKILSQSTSKTGYAQVSTRIGGRKGTPYCFKVHRLVAEAFLGHPSDDLLEEASKTFYKKVIINHIDGNKVNNNVDNLEWSSPSENSKHAFRLGLNSQKEGFDNPLFKLTIDEVLYIKEHMIPKHREFGARALGRKFGIDHMGIIKAYHMDIPSEYLQYKQD